MAWIAPARSWMASELAPLAGAVVLFDLDGTLVDTAQDLIGTLNVVLGGEGLPPLPLEAARGLIGQGARRLLERGFEAAGAPLGAKRGERLFARFIAHYRAHIADSSRPFPGAPEALHILAEAGARLAVCTNKPTALSVALLDALSLSRFFAAVVGSDAADARKPDPRHLHAAIRAAGGEPGTRAVMVGDAAPDAEAARRAGVPLVLVDFGYSDPPAAQLGPDALIHHFEALPQACARLLGACRA